MSETVKYKYIVDCAPDGTPEGLMRICETETRLWGESYDDGQWIEERAALTYLREPPRYGRYIDEADAERFASVLDDGA